jgi:hypothetical protein
MRRGRPSPDSGDDETMSVRPASTVDLPVLIPVDELVHCGGASDPRQDGSWCTVRGLSPPLPP